MRFSLKPSELGSSSVPLFLCLFYDANQILPFSQRDSGKFINPVYSIGEMIKVGVSWNYGIVINAASSYVISV